MKLAGRKHPDCLADSCKCSSVSQMAAGSRLSRCNHGFFSFLHLFQTCLSLNIFEQAVGPSVLQTFSLFAVKPNKCIKISRSKYSNRVVSCSLNYRGCTLTEHSYPWKPSWKNPGYAHDCFIPTVCIVGYDNAVAIVTDCFMLRYMSFTSKQ